VLEQERLIDVLRQQLGDLGDACEGDGNADDAVERQAAREAVDRQLDDHLAKLAQLPSPEDEISSGGGALSGARHHHLHHRNKRLRAAMAAVELRRLVVEAWLDLIVGYLRAEIKVALQAHEQAKEGARARASAGERSVIQRHGENDERHENTHDGGRRTDREHKEKKKAEEEEEEEEEGAKGKGPTKRMMRLEVQQLLAQLEQQESAHTRSSHELGSRLTKLQAENAVKETQLATMEERMRRKLGTARSDAEGHALELEAALVEERRGRAEEKLLVEATEAKLRAQLKRTTAEAEGIGSRMSAEHGQELAALRARLDAQQSETAQAARQERERMMQQALGMRAELERLGKIAGAAEAERIKKAQQEEETLQSFLRGMRRGMRVLKHGRNGKRERRQLKFSRAVAAQIAEAFGAGGGEFSHDASPSPRASPSVNGGAGDMSTMSITWAPRSGSSRSSLSRLVYRRPNGTGTGTEDGRGSTGGGSGDTTTAQRVGQDSSVDIGEIDGVEAGAHLFARNPIKSPHCLSLLLPHRSVDLEFESSDECR
jgi:hypothetical protein